MRRTTALISAAAVAVGGITGTVIWLAQPSYDNIVTECAKELAAQSKAGGEGKSDACKDVKDDDYGALVLNQAMNGEGWLDENGDFDENKFLEGALDDQ